jgi:hypothetical protein
MGMKRDKKDDEDNGGTGGGHPYSNLEKTAVLQEARYYFTIDHGKSDELGSGPNWKKIARFKRLENSRL